MNAAKPDGRVVQANVVDGLPSSIQTEGTVLGAMLLDSTPSPSPTPPPSFRPEDFALDSHQRTRVRWHAEIGASKRDALRHIERAAKEIPPWRRIHRAAPR